MYHNFTKKYSKKLTNFKIKYLLVVQLFSLLTFKRLGGVAVFLVLCLPKLIKVKREYFFLKYCKYRQINVLNS